MRNKRFGKIFIIPVALLIITIASFVIFNLASFQNTMKTIKGELIGNRFNISFYDNFGNRIVTVQGKKVGLEANYIEAETVSATGETGTIIEPSSVITMTIDGHQGAQVGNTVIFADPDLKEIVDFSLPAVITTEGGTINIVDRNINKLRNYIGTSKVIAICSQLGVPIAVYGGESVYWEIPSDLPKMTKLIIDGKPLYVHRANYILLDTALIPVE